MTKIVVFSGIKYKIMVFFCYVNQSHDQGNCVFLVLRTRHGQHDLISCYFSNFLGGSVS